MKVVASEPLDNRDVGRIYQTTVVAVVLVAVAVAVADKATAFLRHHMNGFDICCCWRLPPFIQLRLTPAMAIT